MTARVATRWGAVVVAAGRGERFAGDKVMAQLCDVPIIGWSLRAILADARISEVAVVLSIENAGDCGRFIRETFPADAVVCCHGGAERAASVRAGLRVLTDAVTHVAVHDAVRPLIAPAIVSAVLDAAEESGAAVPVVPLTCTLLVEGSGRVSAGPLDRAHVREVQTPQAARRDYLEAALDAFPNETDESSALFRAGHDLALVDGSPSNIKITVQDDLRLAEALLDVRLKQA